MRFSLPLLLLFVIVLALCNNFCGGMDRNLSTDLSLSQPGSSYYQFQPPTLESSNAASMRMETSSYNFEQNGKKNGKSNKKNQQPGHAYPPGDQSNQYYTQASTGYGDVPYSGQGFHSMSGLEKITYGSVKETKKPKKWFGKGK
ncbi:hypothetical protein niasHT_009141 [Heterodera trifolii]|uniref:Secreted protein n=1 Tax=Heterodera trifolii TaxID=157864 RepID=A0ABD2M9A8_9BILA